jgi:hypothetical protein
MFVPSLSWLNDGSFSITYGTKRHAFCAPRHRAGCRRCMNRQRSLPLGGRQLCGAHQWRAASGPPQPRGCSPRPRGAEEAAACRPRWGRVGTAAGAASACCTETACCRSDRRSCCRRDSAGRAVAPRCTREATVLRTAEAPPWPCLSARRG